MADSHTPPPDPPTNGGDAQETLALNPSLFTAAGRAITAAKRQRRPSVRLGDIGEQPAASDPFLRRPKLHKFSSSASREMSISAKNPSGTRNLTHLEPLAESPDEKEENLETLAASIRKGNRDSKLRRGRQIRSSLISNPDACDPKSRGGEDAGDEGFRSEFNLRREDSLSPVDCDMARVRIPEGEVPSETNGGDWEDRNGWCGSDDDDDDDAIGGVRPWLNRLGLGRYAPVFDIHEVDDEVLPLLTLDDLKDMGINAIGSRRKMFCAIQKLNKNLT